MNDVKDFNLTINIIDKCRTRRDTGNVTKINITAIKEENVYKKLW